MITTSRQARRAYWLRGGMLGLLLLTACGLTHVPADADEPKSTAVADPLQPNAAVNQRNGAAESPQPQTMVPQNAKEGDPTGKRTRAEDDSDEDTLSNESLVFSRTDALIASLTIFVLAIFVGFELITKVPPTLHTPLMSGSNAISGITIVGAILMAGSSGVAAFIGMLAVALATINVIGGFMVTDRMLSMFRKR